MPLNVTPGNHITDVGYWQDRAEEARANADLFKDAHTKEMMLSISESYDGLARAAERMLAAGRAATAQTSAKYINVALSAWQTMERVLLDQGDEILRLRNALEASVKLQSNHAEVLNSYDGGSRPRFASAQEWIDRLT